MKARVREIQLERVNNITSLRVNTNDSWDMSREIRKRFEKTGTFFKLKIILWKNDHVKAKNQISSLLNILNITI